jgi:hypothetical protein
MSILEELKALDEQRYKLIEDAKASTLEKARDAIKQLNELGLNYRLVEGVGTKRAPKERPRLEAPKRHARDVACPICKFKTTPLHDRRSHRLQEVKRPYTPEELKAKGLKKVE